MQSLGREDLTLLTFEANLVGNDRQRAWSGNKFYLEGEGDPRVMENCCYGNKMSREERFSNWFWALLCCPCTFGISVLGALSPGMRIDRVIEVEWDQIVSPFKVDLRNLELTPVFGQFNHAHDHQHHIVWY